MDSDRVPTELIDAAVAACGPIRRFYLAGGGSEGDLRTDLSYVCEAFLEALLQQAPAPMTRRRPRVASYVGPERRVTRP